MGSFGPSGNSDLGIPVLQITNHWWNRMGSENVNFDISLLQIMNREWNRLDSQEMARFKGYVSNCMATSNGLTKGNDISFHSIQILRTTRT